MPIYGDHAYTYRATADSVSGYEIIKKLKVVIETNYSPVGFPLGSYGHHWELDPVQTSDIDAANAGSTTDFYLLIRPKQQTWTLGDEPADNNLEDPNDQQILFHGTSDMIYVVYAPAGGIAAGNYNFAFTPGSSGSPTAFTTGKRRLVPGATGGITSALSNGNFWLAEYRDQSAVTKFPFSSLFIGLESGTTLPSTVRYGIHVGRIIAPYNLNDPKISPAGPAITGDGIFIGATGSGAVAATNNYFLGDWTTLNVGPCVRVGSNWYNINLENNVDAGNALLNDINGKERLVPYEIFAEVVSSTQTPLIGYTKYIRQFKSAITVQPTVIRNNIAGSYQAWLGWIPVNGTGNNNNQIALWNKYLITAV